MHRRSWLKLGIGAAALLALGGGATALIEPGLRGGQLTASGRRVFRHAARGLLQGTLSTVPSQQAAELEVFLDRVNALMAALPRHAQIELSQLLALLDSSVGRRTLAVLDTSWERADIAQLHESFQAMRTSKWKLRQQAYHALHDITGAAYFSDRDTWSQLGYPGPIVV